MLFIHTWRLNVSLGACIVLWSGCERPVSACSRKLSRIWEHLCTSVGHQVGEASDPSHCAPGLYPHTTGLVSHHVKLVDKSTSTKLESTSIQKAKCFHQIPCLVIPASVLVKTGESEMEMQSISLNGGRKLALKTETKPDRSFIYLLNNSRSPKIPSSLGDILIPLLQCRCDP